MTIRLGIIGLSADKSAWASSAHIAALKTPPLLDKYTVTALSTSSPESAQAAAEAHGIPKEKAYSSPEDIAKDPDVDMVVVSVKVPLHKQLTMPALNATKDVFVEWPLGKGLQEAEEMAALAKKQGVKTIVGLQARQHPIVLKAKEIIESGALGRILNTTAVISSSYFEQIIPIKASYFNDPTSGGSIITIPVIHFLDPLCFLLGEFKYLSATTATRFPTVQFTRNDGSKTEPAKRNYVDSVSIQGVLEGGATVSFAFSTTTEATPDQLQWIIVGEKGSLKFEGTSIFIALFTPTLYQSTPGKSGKGRSVVDASTRYSVNSAKDGAEWRKVEFSNASPGGMGEIYAAFAEGKKTYVDFDEAVKRHKMVGAIERSAANGTRESY